MALDLSGQSQTCLFSRETTDSTRLMPLYEYLDSGTDLKWGFGISAFGGAPGRDRLR
jgi:hypothetical protein